MTGIDIAFGIARRFWWVLPLALAAIYVLILRGNIAEQRRTIERQETRIAALTSDLNQCRANTAALNASISRQNAAVSAMRAQGEARVAELDRVAQRARQEAESANARAARIMARRPTGDACADARALIMEATR